MDTSDLILGKENVFVIAEIGNNHNGNVDLAIDMVNAANQAGADCVKFQMRNMSSVYRQKSLAKEGEDLATEYTLDLLERFQLTIDEHEKVAQHCKDNGILYMCTPWDLDSIATLEALDVKGYKIASADLTNLPLIENLIATEKPLILSTGMSSGDEIQITTDFLILEKPNLFYCIAIALILRHSMTLILIGCKSSKAFIPSSAIRDTKGYRGHIGCSRTWGKSCRKTLHI